MGRQRDSMIFIHKLVVWVLSALTSSIRVAHVRKVVHGRISTTGGDIRMCVGDAYRSFQFSLLVDLRRRWRHTDTCLHCVHSDLCTQYERTYTRHEAFSSNFSFVILFGFDIHSWKTKKKITTRARYSRKRKPFSWMDFAWMNLVTLAIFFAVMSAFIE